MYQYFVFLTQKRKNIVMMVLELAGAVHYNKAAIA